MFPYGVAGLPPRRKLEAQMYVTGDPPAGDVQVTNLVTSVARGFFCARVLRERTKECYSILFFFVSSRFFYKKFIIFTLYICNTPVYNV